MSLSGARSVKFAWLIWVEKIENLTWHIHEFHVMISVFLAQFN